MLSIFHLELPDYRYGKILEVTRAYLGSSRHWRRRYREWLSKNRKTVRWYLCSKLKTHWEIFNWLSLPLFLLPSHWKWAQATLCSPQTGKWPEWQAAHTREDYTRKPREVGTGTGLKQVYQCLKNLACCISRHQKWEWVLATVMWSSSCELHASQICLSGTEHRETPWAHESSTLVPGRKFLAISTFHLDAT